MGFSREKAARELDVSYKTLQRWESGAGAPRRWQLLLLAQLYDVHVDDLTAEEVGAGS